MTFLDLGSSYISTERWLYGTLTQYYVDSGVHWLNATYGTLTLWYVNSIVCRLWSTLTQCYIWYTDYMVRWFLGMLTMLHWFHGILILYMIQWRYDRWWTLLYCDYCTLTMVCCLYRILTVVRWLYDTSTLWYADNANYQNRCHFVHLWN